MPTIEKLDSIAPVLGVHPITLLVGTYALKEDRSVAELLKQVEQEAERFELTANLAPVSRSSR